MSPFDELADDGGAPSSSILSPYSWTHSFSDLKLPELLGGFVGALCTLCHNEIHSFDGMVVLFFFTLVTFLSSTGELTNYS